MIQKETGYNQRNTMPPEQYTSIHQEGQAQSIRMLKRIGSTTYRVNVHFSSSSRETVGDKILRLAKSEVMAE